MAASGRLLSLNTGRAVPVMINGRKVLTAIGKRSVEGPRAVLRLGIEADEQANLSVHGGLSKAVYAYPSEHYPFWNTVRAQAQAALWDDALPYGSLGENLSLEGLVESGMWIGDVLRFPGCELAISEPRTPCFKFNAAMGFAQATNMMLQSGWCGTYLAVRSAGSIEAGQTFQLIAGPREVGIAELFRARMGRALAL
ncbi:MAG: MOSC domain-containing protein [Pseudomonadota bacterium]|nr:MOSC domain-containing protein [Pseudomonadota bacterium]